MKQNVIVYCPTIPENDKELYWAFIEEFFDIERLPLKVADDRVSKTIGFTDVNEALSFVMLTKSFNAMRTNEPAMFEGLKKSYQEGTISEYVIEMCAKLEKRLADNESYLQSK